MNYKTFSLSEVVEKVIDNRGLTPKKLGGDWSDVGYRVISAKNIKNRSLVQEDKIRTIDDSLYSRWMDDDIHRGDIILTSEAPCGETLFWDSDEKIVLGQRLFGIRVKKGYDPYYLFLYLNTRGFQNELSSRMTGTTVQGIRQSELMKCRLSLPSYDVQVAVTKQIKPIDDLIRLNDRINDYLDKLAREMFEHEAIMYDVATIPLSKFAEINKDSLSGKTHNQIFHYLDTGNITKNNIKSYQKFRYEELPSRARRLVKDGDMVYSTVRPNQLHFGLLTSVPENCVVSTGFAVIRSTDNRISNEIIYLSLSDSKVIEYLQGVAESSTSTYPSITPNDLGNIEIPIISDNTQKTLKLIFNIINSNQCQNRILNDVREKLMGLLFNYDSNK